MSDQPKRRPQKTKAAKKKAAKAKPRKAPAKKKAARKKATRKKSEPLDGAARLAKANAARTAKADRNKRRFLSVFRRNGAKLQVSCYALRIARETVLRWRDTDEAFRTAYEEAKTLANELVETKLWREAIGGNIRAMKIYLEANKPEQYRRGHQTPPLRDAETDQGPEGFLHSLHRQIEDAFDDMEDAAAEAVERAIDERFTAARLDDPNIIEGEFTTQ